MKGYGAADGPPCGIEDGDEGPAPDDPGGLDACGGFPGELCSSGGVQFTGFQVVAEVLVANFGGVKAVVAEFFAAEGGVAEVDVDFVGVFRTGSTEEVFGEEVDLELFLGEDLVVVGFCFDPDLVGGKFLDGKFQAGEEGLVAGVGFQGVVPGGGIGWEVDFEGSGAFFVQEGFGFLIGFPPGIDDLKEDGKVGYGPDIFVPHEGVEVSGFPRPEEVAIGVNECFVAV